MLSHTRMASHMSIRIWDIPYAYGQYTHMGQNNITPNSLFTFSHEERTRGHSMKLFYPTVNYSTRHNFFTIQIINLWNNLPESIISVDSVSLFKKKLDDYLNQLRYGHNQRPRSSLLIILCLI